MSNAPRATLKDLLPERQSTWSRVLWWALALPAFGTGLYAIAMQDARQDRAMFYGQAWVDYLHFAAGGLALIVGVFAFRRDVLRKRLRLHRKLGMAYMFAVLLSGITAVLMATVSFAGPVTNWGFGALGVLWLLTSGVGLLAVKRKQLAGHRRWMVRSYALCYAAVTLRIQLGPLTAWFDGDFAPPSRTVGPGRKLGLVID